MIKVTDNMVSVDGNIIENISQIINETSAFVQSLMADGMGAETIKAILSTIFAGIGESDAATIEIKYRNIPEYVREAMAACLMYYFEEGEVFANVKRHTS